MSTPRSARPRKPSPRARSTAAAKALPKPPTARPGAPGGVRDLNRKRNEEALDRAALALFLEKGLEAVTVDDVVRRADMAKGSFYRYAESLDAVAARLVAPVEARMAQAFEESRVRLESARTREEALAGYESVAAGIVEVVLGHAEVVQLYLQESRGAERGARIPFRKLAARIDEAGVALTVLAQQHGIIRPFDPRVSSQAVIGAGERLALQVLGGKELGDPLALPGQLIELVLDGVRGPALERSQP